MKIVGLLIEAALRPAPGNALPRTPHLGPEQADVVDLGRLLYACLVSRWPGGPAFSLPAAPVGRAPPDDPAPGPGRVSPALDGVCDQILGDPPRHRAERLASANDVVTRSPRSSARPTPPPISSAGCGSRSPVTSTPPISIPLHARRRRVHAPRRSPGRPLSPSHSENEDSVRVTLIRERTPPPPSAAARDGSQPGPGVARDAGSAPRRRDGTALLATGIGSARDPQPARAAARSPASRTRPVSPGRSPAPDHADHRRPHLRPQGEPPNDENNGGQARRRRQPGHPVADREVPGQPEARGLKRGVGLIVDWQARAGAARWTCASAATARTSRSGCRRPTRPR